MLIAGPGFGVGSAVRREKEKHEEMLESWFGAGTALSEDWS